MNLKVQQIQLNEIQKQSATSEVTLKQNQILLRDLKSFVSEERNILNLILHHLREVEAKIQSGTLSLSVIAKAQTHFRQQNVPIEEKILVLKELENKSIKESEKILFSLAPIDFQPIEKVRPTTAELTEVRLTLRKETLAKLQTAKERFSHQNLSLAEIFDCALDALLEKKNAAPLPPLRSQNVPMDATASQENLNVSNSPSSNEKIRNPFTRHIPKALKSQIFHRDRGACQFKDPVSGRVCGSKFYLQYDHVQPLALGGRTEAGNLRLLCGGHNRLLWEKAHRQSSVRALNPNQIHK